MLAKPRSSQLYLVSGKLVLVLLHLGFCVVDDALGRVYSLHAVLHAMKQKVRRRKSSKISGEQQRASISSLYLPPPVLLCVLLGVLDHVLDVVFAQTS